MGFGSGTGAYPQPFVGEEIDRYEELVANKPDHLTLDKYYRIYERDKLKGIRRTIVNSSTGEIIRETK